MRPVVLNNPPNTKYYSSKGVLITPHMCRSRKYDITKITDVKAKTTIIDQSKLWWEYLNKMKQFTDSNSKPKKVN